MPGPKQNNNRRFPNADRQPRHKAAERQGRLDARKEAYDALSLEQKIALLPPEPYAKRQRTRLMGLLEKKSQPKQETAVLKSELYVVGADTSPKQDQPKKYMKGSK
jgi:hypothetical protein